MIYGGGIDILQSYGAFKQTEVMIKSFVSDQGGVSVSPPPFYRRRFEYFITEYVFQPDKSIGKVCIARVACAASAAAPAHQHADAIRAGLQVLVDDEALSSHHGVGSPLSMRKQPRSVEESGSSALISDYIASGQRGGLYDSGELARQQVYSMAPRVAHLPPQPFRSMLTPGGPGVCRPGGM